MRESRTYGSVRGACDETHVPTATGRRQARGVGSSHEMMKSRERRLFSWSNATCAMPLRDALSSRNVFQLCEGGVPPRTMYLETVDCATAKPSIRSSPWTRDAPHSGFPCSSVE